jgi:uncharacterized protein
VGKRSEHAPGTFSWVDLTTSDDEASKEFYAALFGWTYEGLLAKLDGDYVAAIPPAVEGFPPHWNSYVTVTSADETTAKAKELGANVIEEPFDVMEAGRMALFQDPTGASLCVWEPRDSIGATRVNDVGCLTWNELHTPDPARALEFYAGLFGWTSEEMGAGEGGVAYTVIRNGERTNGGVMPAQEGEPPSWIPYFVVESRGDSLAKAEELGGRSLFQMDMPQGKIAGATDPQGAVFALWEGPTDD